MALETRKGFICRRLRDGHGKGDGDELPKSTLSCGGGGVARTALDIKLLVAPGGLGEFLFDRTVFGFSPACSLTASI